MYTRKANATREAPWRGQSNDQLEAREGQAGRHGVAERFVVPLKLGNAGGGKGPQFKTDAIRGEGPGRLGIKRPIRKPSDLSIQPLADWPIDRSVRCRKAHRTASACSP